MRWKCDPLPSATFIDAQQPLVQAPDHPARIAIWELRRCEARYCSDTGEELPLAQATASQHLKVIKEAGLIPGTIDPRRSGHGIGPQGWAQALLKAFLGDATPLQATNCCA